MNGFSGPEQSWMQPANGELRAWFACMIGTIRVPLEISHCRDPGPLGVSTQV